MTPSFPIARYLTPAHSDPVPEGFTLVDGQVAKGLPHYVELSDRLRIKVTAPTGLARQWLDVAADAVISASEDQAAPFDPAAPARMLDGQTPRLALIKDGRVIGSAALTLGPVFRFIAGEEGAAAEVAVLGWRLSAGVLRGPVSDGSFVRLAWREADKAISEFGPPPVSDFVIRRAIPRLRIESLIYRHWRVKYRGHLLKSMTAKVQHGIG